MVGIILSLVARWRKIGPISYEKYVKCIIMRPALPSLVTLISFRPINSELSQIQKLSKTSIKPQPCQPSTFTFILDQKNGETCLSYGDNNRDDSSKSSSSRRKSRQSKSKSSSSSRKHDKREKRSLKLKAVSRKIDEVTKMTNKYVDEVNRLILKNEDIDVRVKQLYLQLLHEIVEKRDVELDVTKLQNDWLNKANTVVILEKDFHKLKAEHERVLRIYVQQASSIDSLTNKFKELERETNYLKKKCLGDDGEIPYEAKIDRQRAPIKMASPIKKGQSQSQKSNTSSASRRDTSRAKKPQSPTTVSKNTNNRRKVTQKSQISAPIAPNLKIFTPEPVAKIPNLTKVNNMETTAVASCKTAYERGITMNSIVLHDTINKPVVCDTKLGSGWLVINQRINDLTNFNRNWDSYKQGFGNFEGNFWLGLENIHKITKNKKFKLRIELYDWDSNYVYAEYSKFGLSDESDGYRISVSGYSGTAGDSLVEHDKQRFTTPDRDNDPMITRAWGFKKINNSTTMHILKCSHVEAK